MTILTARQVAQYLVDNGCPSSRVVPWAAVALGESGWNTRAVSPVGARGLFQFMPGSWPNQAGSYENAWDAGVSCLACMSLSGTGTNFAPWDSTYRNIYLSGRLSFLGYPEVGSAVWSLIPKVAAMLGPGYHAQIIPLASPVITSSLPGALQWYATATSTVLPRLQRQMRGYGVSASRTY